MIGQACGQPASTGDTAKSARLLMDRKFRTVASFTEDFLFIQELSSTALTRRPVVSGQAIDFLIYRRSIGQD